MVDELSSRRSRFPPGTPICLANDQEWTFPAPTADSESAFEPAGAEYLGLIHAVQEAEDQSERRLAELALAIFLIGLNYDLSSTDLAQPVHVPAAIARAGGFATARSNRWLAITFARWQDLGSSICPFLPRATQGHRLPVESSPGCAVTG